MSLKNQVTTLFNILDQQRAGSLPDPGRLSQVLQKKISAGGRQIQVGSQRAISPDEAALFASAGVEMWLRSVHSFLISTATHQLSPIWSAVAGYYSSHYCVRGFAHLTGFFQIRKLKCIVESKVGLGGYHFYIHKKNYNDGEHKFYWKLLKAHPQLSKNPFITENPEDQDVSDLAHRSMANYFDHVDHFPNFQPIERRVLIERIEYLSKMNLTDVPIPSRENFPDLINVHLVAYHRMVYFRRILDEILGGRSRYWNVYRNPSWCRDYINFQVVEPKFLESLNYSIL